MPATTTHGFPYVEPGDAVHDYPATSKALADKLESTPPPHVEGHLIAYGASGGLDVSPNASSALQTQTFHRAFPKPPAVAITLQSSNDLCFPVIVAVSTTNVQFKARNVDSLAAKVWIAGVTVIEVA